ncbi:hypothetical protein GCM10020358_12320 [Amorphoplanes nipponensis]|uniref:LigA protein n=1 Tax=Actinoplanes nipponensis TaxID=135950 RepID=A0A919JK98_9ACTN|nr:hypothetical protein [Actinoplanes nipponensis]GIE50731.1 hypothetical protein Ani05nite_42650 [Actinoplanes nipponensis]
MTTRDLTAEPVPVADGTIGGGPPAPLPGVPRAAWQVRARTRIEDLRRQLRELNADHGESVADLSGQLTEAESALRGGGPMRWLRGGDVEYAWQTIHAVEEAMVALRSRADLVGRLPGHVAAAARYLPGDHPALAALGALTPEERQNEPTLRAAVQTLMRACHAASDEFHESARRLRNRMLGISSAALLAEAVLLLVQWRSDDLRLITAPSDASATAPWKLLGFVMLAGALGAFVSGVPSMISSRSGGLPYRLPTQQALLKLAIGPLVAIVGIMLILGGLAGVTVGTVAALLGVAVVFGAGQQAVTGFADRRASELLRQADKA